MKAAYPIIMSRGKEHIVVFVPDFNINTQGKDYPDAMAIARDAIGLMGIYMEDEKEAIPRPSALVGVAKENDADVVTLVDVDFAEYRRKNDMLSNVPLSTWLN